MAQSKQYNVNAWTKGINGFGSQMPALGYSATLAATTDTTLTVPTSAAMGTPRDKKNKWLAIFHYDSKTAANVYVNLNATAAVPVAASFGASTSVLKPDGKIVEAGDTLHFISDTASINVTVEFFAIQEGA